MAKKITVQFFTNLPAHEKKITISTIITLIRIGLTPFIVGAMVAHCWGIACILFVIAAITDGVDGYLARIRNERTFLGAALDPIADKILLLSCFFTLAFVQSPLFTIPLWFVIVVLIKELVVIGGACVVYYCTGDVEISPTRLGKTTTVIQISFIMWLFACYFFAWMPVKTYYTMLGLVLLVVGASLVQYVRIGYHQFRIEQ